MYIKLKIDCIEEENTILKTEDNQEINWPTNKLPDDSFEGGELYFLITNISLEKPKQELAKNILNEILDVDEK